MEKLVYSDWVNLKPEERTEILENLKQDADGQPCPLGSHKFPEENFIKL